MTNVYILHETIFNFWVIILDLLSFISVVLSTLIIISKNPILSVIFLILLFSSISCYLIFIGIKFIGISYLLVYVGAVSILFLFILMLINIRISELVTNTSNSIPLAILSILGIFNPLNDVMLNINLNKQHMLSFFTNINMSYASSKNWDATISDSYDIMSIGNIMYTSYSLWLIITSIILLLAMVGAIVITLNPTKTIK